MVPPLRQRLHSGETVVGPLQIYDSAQVAECTGVAGMDFVVFDQEHGPLTAETTLEMAAAAERGGASPLVRVRENSPAEIQRALDAGAGVQIPQVESKSHAEKAVRAARFAPIGERGLSQYVRAGNYVGDPDYTENQNQTQTVVLQVEGQQGVDNIDDIVAVSGFDVVFLGPYDLSQSMGVPGQVRDEKVEAAMEQVVERATAADKIVGTFADDPEMARHWIELGVQYVMLSVDAPIFVRALEDLLRQTSPEH
jgi:4-hydroxy-2-oxoheptanedioate aldolase